MICLRYYILLLNLGCFLFDGSCADGMEFIAEKRQREGIMATRRPITVNGCVEECEDIKACYAVNYFRLNATCQLLNQTMPESKLIKANKCLYKAVRSPPQESIENDPCYKKTCPWDEMCTYNKTTNSAECYPLCTTPPARSGTINSTAEVEVGENYTYICQAGLVAKAGHNPTVTCLPDGSWTSTNFACVCTTPPAKSGAMNEMPEVEIGQNYTYKCQVGLLGEGLQNPTVTCLQDGSWTSTNFICVKRNWTQDTKYLNNVNRSDIIRNVTKIDLLACMQQCDDLNDCLSFFYDNHTGLCALSSSFRKGPPLDVQSNYGWIYYTALCDMEYGNVSLGGSYVCIKYHDTKNTFQDAMAVCNSEKAKMLAVTKESEIADIKKFIGSNMGWTFIGISDESIEGKWVNGDGVAVLPFWNPSEPNGGISENCAVLTLANTGLVDFSCNVNLRFLCCK